MKYLLACILLVGLASSISPEPRPTCSPPSFHLQELPISPDETQTFNLDDLFTGFNLQYNLSSTAPEFAHLRQKFTQKDHQTLAQPNIRSYHLDHVKNEWGKQFLTMSEDDREITLRWGFSDSFDIVPQLTQTGKIPKKADITCFDALLFRADHLILLDCVKKATFGLTNVFLYYNITAQAQVDKEIENDMYIGFTTITRRKMFVHENDGIRYILRSYFADSVDKHHDHNTYFEVMIANDLMKIRTHRVIDRSFLHQEKLSITDFKIYYGVIYMLDFHSGVVVMGLTKSQHVLIGGRYRTDSGFQKLGVYTGNLDHEIILALANHHAIYEIDFSNRLQPEIIAKYNLMEDAIVTSLWVNRLYVVAQVTGNVTDGQNQSVWYNSSIVFSRGTRTYLTAYGIIEHKNYRAVVDLNRDLNMVFVMDEQKMVTYTIQTPYLNLLPNKNHLGKEYTFDINAYSVNTNTGARLACMFSMKFKVVDQSSRQIFKTGIQLPETYYANYPGQLFIPLGRYAIGPNITWGVKEKAQGQDPHPSAFWILQQNTTNLHWERQPSFFKITFLRQEQYDSIAETDLFLYTQEYNNVTHFVKCRTVPYTRNVTCQEEGHKAQVNHHIQNLTANKIEYYAGQTAHVAAILYDEFPNEVFLYDVETKNETEFLWASPLIFPKGYEGRVSSVQFVSHYLVVVLRYVKEIVFFDIRQCANLAWEGRTCHEYARIDSILMDELKVKYFAPIQVYRSDDYPYVLFIQNIDSVIILDITFPMPTLLAQIHSPGTQEPGFYKWKMAIAHHHLVLVNPPNIIEEHSLLELYTLRDAPMTRTYPTYSYTIPDKFDLDFSDAGDMVYITAEDKNLPEHMNSVILVYRAGLPASAVFYDVFHINGKYEDIQIDATGNFGDYIGVTLGSMLMMFRQYEEPILVFDDSYSDFKFNISYTNDPNSTYKYLAQSEVKVANFQEKIVLNNTEINESDYLSKHVDYQNEYQKIPFNDSTWFNGSVVNYSLQGCSECGEKLSIINHLHDERDFHASMDMDDYVFTIHGGIVQQFQSQISMQHNGSINQYISLPAVLDGQLCKHIAYSLFYDFAVSACLRSQEVYLYLTEFHSSKPFVNGPHYSSAKTVASLQMMEDIFIVVDVDENPGIMSRQGGIIIYALNHDYTEPEIFDELEFIDTTDLMAAPGWTGKNVYISNAHLVYTNMSSIYRLVITQIQSGLFFVDFKWTKGRRSVEITKVQFYDMREELVKHHLPMPNNAYFEAVSVSHEYFDPTFKYWEIELIVTTRNFHIFQVNTNFDPTGSLQHPKIAHVYYRYGFYETSNYLKVFDGYFAVAQKIPILYKDYPWFSQQVLTVYDTKERFKPMLFEEDVPASRMLGGMVFPAGRLTFDFNFTFVRNETDPLRNIGLLVLHSRQAYIKELSINDNIFIVTEEGIPNTQNAIFRANNDYSYFEIPLDILIDNGQLPGWAIALIVIGSLLIGGLGGFIAWKKFTATKPKSEIKTSLLEDEANKQNSEEQEEESGQEEEESQGDEEESQEEEEEEKKELAEKEVKKEPVSINRQTITSVDEERRSIEENLEKVEEKEDEEKSDKAE